MMVMVAAADGDGGVAADGVVKMVVFLLFSIFFSLRFPFYLIFFY